MGTIKLNKGEILFHEGDAEDRLYVVITGKIKLGRSGSAGRENLLAILGPGQMFGELSCSIPARAPDRNCGDRLPDPDPGARGADGVADRPPRGRPGVVRELAAPAAPRQRRAWPIWSSPTSRVASPSSCWSSPQRFGDRREDGIHVHHDLTQEELAQLVGASRETVNKALADFAARGWIRLEPRSVTILDVRAGRAPRPLNPPAHAESAPTPVAPRQRKLGANCNLETNQAAVCAVPAIPGWGRIQGCGLRWVRGCRG